MPFGLFNGPAIFFVKKILKKKFEFFLFIFFFSKSKKNYFGRQKSTFYPYEHHYWPKLTQIWPKFGHIWLYQARSTGVQKFWKKKLKNFEFVFVFSKSKKNYFGRQKSTFSPYEHHYDSPLPTLRKILKFLKWRF